MASNYFTEGYEASTPKKICSIAIFCDAGEHCKTKYHLGNCSILAKKRA